MEFELKAWSDTILAFVRDHKAWAPLVVGVLAFGESLAFISLILPFFVILVAIGALFGASGGIDFIGILVGAAVGAALGDWLSYWLGYHYAEQIGRMWPLSRYPELLPKGRAFFERFGAWAIVLGRFSGPLRASVPIVAGALRMPPVTFQLANWSSAFLWAGVLLTLGDGMGRAYHWVARALGFG